MPDIKFHGVAHELASYNRNTNSYLPSPTYIDAFSMITHSDNTLYHCVSE
jgi:hypothetical protein